MNSIEAFDITDPNVVHQIITEFEKLGDRESNIETTEVEYNK